MVTIIFHILVCINHSYITNISRHLIQQFFLDNNRLTRYSIDCTVQKPHILQALTCIGVRILDIFDKKIASVICLWMPSNYNIRRHTLSNKLSSQSNNFDFECKLCTIFLKFDIIQFVLHFLHAWFWDREKMIWIGATNNIFFLFWQADTLHQLCGIKSCTEIIWSFHTIDSLLIKPNDRLFHHFLTVVNEGLDPTIIQDLLLLFFSKCSSRNISRW